METKVKLFKTITIILIIIAVSLISFVGIFRNKLNLKESIIPVIILGMELSGNREFKFVLDNTSEEKEVYVDEDGNYKGTVVKNTTADTSAEISLDTTVEDSQDVVAEEEVNKVQFATVTKNVKANEDDVLNKDSYEKTKNIIQKRLENAGIPEYNLRLNTITGELVLEVPEDSYTQDAYDLAVEQGKFEIVDAQTGVVLLNNSHLKKAQALYAANDAYQAYLQIEFNDEGKEILRNISKEYVKTVDDSGETTKNVELRLDNGVLLSTYFGEELDQGMLQITMGQATTDYNTFMEGFNSARSFANIVSFGMTPNKLELESDNFVMSQITDKTILCAKVAFAVIIVAVSAVLIVKYKLEGLLAACASIGYVAVTLLAIRYTNVTITLNSVIAILGITAVNYVFMFDFLNKKKTDSANHAFLETIKKLNVAIIPLWVVAIIFTFMTHVTINSVGMVLFWGLFIHAIYSFVVTRTLYI